MKAVRSPSRSSLRRGLLAFETVAEAYELKTGHGVDLLIVPQNQLFSKQLLAATGSGEYVAYTAILAKVGLFYGGDFATLLEKVDSGFEGRPRITRYDNECRWDPPERFITRDSAVMGLPINGNIDLEYCGRDLYDEVDLEAPPETWDDVATAANKAQKRYDCDIYCCLECGERGANAASYDRQTQ